MGTDEADVEAAESSRAEARVTAPAAPTATAVAAAPTATATPANAEKGGEANE